MNQRIDMDNIVFHLEICLALLRRIDDSLVLDGIGNETLSSSVNTQCIDINEAIKEIKAASLNQDDKLAPDELQYLHENPGLYLLISEPSEIIMDLKSRGFIHLDGAVLSTSRRAKKLVNEYKSALNMASK